MDKQQCCKAKNSMVNIMQSQKIYSSEIKLATTKKSLFADSLNCDNYYFIYVYFITFAVIH